MFWLAKWETSNSGSQHISDTSSQFRRLSQPDSSVASTAFPNQLLSSWCNSFHCSFVMVKAGRIQQEQFLPEDTAGLLHRRSCWHRTRQARQKSPLVPLMNWVLTPSHQRVLTMLVHTGKHKLRRNLLVGLLVDDLALDVDILCNAGAGRMSSTASSTAASKAATRA